MSRETTAVMLVSPLEVGAWRDNLWRIGAAAQLVEGGSAAYWTNLEPNGRYTNDEAGLVIDNPDDRAIADSVLIWIAANWAQVDLLGPTRRDVVEANERGQVAFRRGAGLGAEVRQRLTDWCAVNARIALVRLVDNSLLADSVVQILRGAGIAIETFSPSDRQS